MGLDEETGSMPESAFFFDLEVVSTKWENDFSNEQKLMLVRYAAARSDASTICSPLLRTNRSKAEVVCFIRRDS